jgi:hypothetical protein
MAFTDYDDLDSIQLNFAPPTAQAAPSVKVASPYGAVGDTLGNISEGVAKGEASTLKGLGTIGQSFLDQTVGRVVNAVQGKGFTPTTGGMGDIYRSGTDSSNAADEFLKPEGTAQNVGFYGEKAAEFLVPSAKPFQAKGWYNVASQFAGNAGIRAAQTGGDVKDSLISGAIGGLFAGIAPLASAAKPTFLKAMSFLSGYDDDVVRAAMERTPGAIAATKDGEPVLTSVVKQTAANLSKFANETLAEAKNTVAELSKLSGGGRGFPGTRQAMLEQGRKFVNNITSSLRSNNNIGVKQGSELIFNRATMPSNIVSRADQSAIQEAFHSVAAVAKDTSIKNIDAIMERLLVLKAKTPAGSPTGGETRKIIGMMMDEVLQFTKSLGPVSPAYAKYAAFLEDNLTKRVFINDAKELFGASANLSPKEVTQITTRLLQLFNSGKSEMSAFAGEVGQKVGTDIVGSAAGTLLKQGDDISVRAANLTKRGIVEKVFEAIPRAVVREFVKSGNVTGMANHPVLKLVASITGQSAEVLAQELASLLEQED